MEEKKENPEELGINKENESEDSNEQEKEETHGPSKRKLSRSSDEEEYERGRKRIKRSVKVEPIRDLGRKRIAEDVEQGVRKKIKTSSLGNSCLQTDKKHEEKEEQNYHKNDQVSSSRKPGQKRSRESDDENEQGKKKIAKVSFSKKTACQREDNNSRKEEQDQSKTAQTSAPKKCVRKRSRTPDEEEKEEEQGRQKRKKITSSEKCDEKKIESNKSVTQDTPKSGPISSISKSSKKRSREFDEEERDKQKMPKISLEKEEENKSKQEEGGHKIHLEQNERPLSDHDKKHGVEECTAGTSGQSAVNEKVHFSQSLTGYDLQKVLGQGGFGKVTLASHKSTNQLVAIKMITKIFVKVVPIQVEERILQIARGSPFLCHGLTSFHTLTHSYFVMEFIRGGTLDPFAAQSESLSITAFRFIAAELVCGIQFLHSKGIIHRDLKFGNIMLDHEGHVKIADFGLAAENIFGSNKANGRIGTLLFMAPEVLEGKAYGVSADWWSFGVILFIMITRKFPFDIKLRGLLYQQQVLNTEPRYPDSLDRDLEDILRKLLDKDPDSRLGVSGNVREHPFFKDIDWQEVELCKAIPPFQPFTT